MLFSKPLFAMQKLNEKDSWRRIIGIKAMITHKEVLPLVAIMGVAVVGCAGFCLYTFNKPDVMLSRADEIPSWMRYSADKRQKLYTDDKNWKKDERIIEMEKLRKEIGSTHG